MKKRTLIIASLILIMFMFSGCEILDHILNHQDAKKIYSNSSGILYYQDFYNSQGIKTYTEYYDLSGNITNTIYY